LSRLPHGYSSNYLMVSDPVFDAFQPAAIAAPDEQARKKYCATPMNMSPGSIFHSLLSPGSFTVHQPWLKGFQASSARSVRRAAPKCFSSIRPVSGSTGFKKENGTLAFVQIVNYSF